MSLRPTRMSVMAGVEYGSKQWHLTDTSMRRIWILLVAALSTSVPAAFCATDARLPVPSLDTLLERVLERARQEEAEQAAFKQCYGYTRTRVTEYRNGDGVLKHRKAKTRVNDPKVVPLVYHPPSPGLEMDLAKRPKESQPVSDTQTNIRGKAFEKSDFPLNEDIIKRFDFTLSGRELINGRAALVIDFKPTTRKVPERGIKDRFINKAAGRVWLDEADCAVAKADLYLSEKVNVIGGLVGAVSKFTLSIQRERTAEGIWFIRDQEWHLEGREVFVRRKVDYYEKYKEVRKVHEPVLFSSIDAQAGDD